MSGENSTKNRWFVSTENLPTRATLFVCALVPIYALVELDKALPARIVEAGRSPKLRAFDESREPGT